MKIFLAKYDLMAYEYMGDCSREENLYRLVYAETADEAEEKVKEYYDKLGSDYSTSYQAQCVSIVEPIM